MVDYWNYRVIKTPDGQSAIHEVFYKDAQPILYADTPAEICWEDGTSGEAPEKLLKMLERALALPVLHAANSGCSKEPATTLPGMYKSTITTDFSGNRVLNLPKDLCADLDWKESTFLAIELLEDNSLRLFKYPPYVPE